MISTYKIERKKVPKPVAERKKLPKFGGAAEDPPGPQPSNVVPAEEMKMQFIRNAQGELLELKSEEDPLAMLKTRTTMFTCQHCKGDHFTKNCPYKDLIEQQKALLEADLRASESIRTGGTGEDDAIKRDADAKMKSGTYVPPAMRSRAAAAEASAASQLDRGRDDNTVRVTNISEDTTEDDLKELFKLQGKANIQRIFLAKDKTSGRSKGFAFVTYKTRDDADRAIRVLHGHRYGYMILKVEWAKQTA